VLTLLLSLRSFEIHDAKGSKYGSDVVVKHHPAVSLDAKDILECFYLTDLELG
jgi:hypothetical protein